MNEPINAVSAAHAPAIAFMNIINSRIQKRLLSEFIKAFKKITY